MSWVELEYGFSAAAAGGGPGNDTTSLAYLVNLIAPSSSAPTSGKGYAYPGGGSPWLYASVCSSLVGLSGLFPVALLSLADTSAAAQRFMLAFACGGLLGDVFLHLLPEAYAGAASEEEFAALGLWVLAGILAFVVVEMLLSHSERVAKDPGGIRVAGYLNLAANCIDNFAHGLAVGGAFLAGPRTGLVTTACILCHEIPHEIGDFAILLNSGFSKADAARAQLSTAAVGVAGAMAALALDSCSGSDGVGRALTAWIVPFTSGGFLNISLVTVLPDLMRQESAADTARVIGGILAGVAAMTAVSHF